MTLSERVSAVINRYMTKSRDYPTHLFLSWPEYQEFCNNCHSFAILDDKSIGQETYSGMIIVITIEPGIMVGFVEKE